MSAKFVLFVGLALTAMGQTVLFAVLGPVVRDMGLSELAAGLIISASALTVVLVSPIWGRVTDRVGRKPVFLFALFGFAITSTSFGFVLHAGMLGWVTGYVALFALLAARVLYALAIAGGQPSATGFIADTSNEKERSGAMAIIGGAFAIGAICGPATAYVLAPFGVLAPIYVTALLGLLWAPVTMAYLDEPQKKDEQQTSPNPPLRARDARIVYLLLGVVCVFTAIAILQQTMAFYVQDLYDLDTSQTAQQTGALIGILAIANLGAFMVVAWQKPPPNQLILLGGGLAISGTIVLFLSTDLEFLFLANVLMGAGFGAFLPGAQTKASLKVAKTEQGAAGGFVAAAMACGYVVGPIVGTGVYMHVEGATFGIAAALTLLGAILASIRGAPAVQSY